METAQNAVQLWQLSLTAPRRRRTGQANGIQRREARGNFGVVLSTTRYWLA